jgi:putative cardiolipin synthase
MPLLYHFIIATTVLGSFLMHGCATLPKDFERPVSHAYTDTGDTLLGQARRDEIAAHPGQAGFLPLGNGLDAFVARAVLAHVAERSIDVQYYLLHNDLVGALFIDQLLKAADRGVRVRLLVDDMDLGGRDLGAAALDSHPNMEVRIFNPFSRKTGRLSQFVTRMGSVTRRMHNKSFTVDNQATILGGRNIGNEYFEADPSLAFADLDVLVIGPVVEEVSTAFDLYWNSELAYPALVLKGQPPTPEEIEQKRQKLSEFVAQQSDSAYLVALRDSDLANNIRQNTVRFYWGKAEVVYDLPEKIQQDFDQTQYHLAPQLGPYFAGVQKELIIFSPYFVPGKERHGVSDAAQQAGRSGADSDQFPSFHGCRHRALGLRQIPQGPIARRGRTLRNEQTADPAAAQGEKRTARFFQGQPARQIVCLRSPNGFYRFAESRSARNSSQYRDRCCARINRTRRRDG